MNFFDKRARVCIATPDFIGPVRNGGIGTACYYQARNLSEAGYRVSILFTGHDEQARRGHWQATYGRLHGWDYVDLVEWAEQTLSDQDRLGNYPATPQLRVSRLALEFFKHHNFDLIFFQDYLGHALYSLHYKRAGLGFEDTRLCVTVHSFRQWILEGMRQFPGDLPDFIAQQVEIETLRLAETLIAPSEYMATWTAGAISLDQAAIKVLPNCYDQSTSQAGNCVKKFGPFENLVFFGRLETRKGLHLFIEAVKSSTILRSRIGTITFLGRQASVLGMDSGEYIRAEMAGAGMPVWRIINDFDTHQALHWLEQQLNTLIVAPSLSDNLPLSIIELFVRRLPFLTTRVGGIPEIVGVDNQHLMAEPTAAALRAELEGIVSADCLRINFAAGYDPREAARAHLAFTEELLSIPTATLGGHASVVSWDHPVVSIIVPHYNSAAYLEMALRTLLRQDFAEPYEIIIVDDHSSGEVWEDVLALFTHLSDPRLRFARMPVNHGPAASRNHGVSLARGGYLVFFDADNEALPHMLSTMTRAIRASSLDCMTCFNRVIKQHDRFSPCPLDPSLASVLYTPIGSSLELGAFINAFGDTCSIMKSQVPEAVGGWPEDRDSREDWEFFTKVCVHGFGFGVIPEVLYLYRDDRGSRRNLRSNAQNYAGQSKILTHLASAHGREVLNVKNLLGFAVGLCFPNQATQRIHANAIYDCFAKLNQDAMRSFLELATDAGATPTTIQAQTLRQARKILYPLVCAWDAAGEKKSVLMYGAGEHSKVLLGLVPGLWHHLVGFIDANPSGEYFGLPCIAPHEVNAAVVNVIVYSSAVHEQAMHARMRKLPVQHVTLYGTILANDEMPSKHGL